MNLIQNKNFCQFDFQKWLCQKKTILSWGEVRIHSRSTGSFLLTVTQDLTIKPSKNHFLMLVLDLKWWQHWDILISYHLKTYFLLFQLKSFCRSIMSNSQKATLNVLICPYLNDNPKLMPKFLLYMNCKFNIKDILKQKF